ncbi:MAG: methionine adenosyltransferase domain-containing protein, partial [Acidobacteria bacterium]|nr:methionine adenosyltransferase domain-containing protein [Acidobacteriota bacterium]
LDWEAIARHVYQDVIGYGAADHLTVIPCVCKQSDDIKIGVDRNGAGDQGIMVGFATDETPEALPLEYVLARNLAWGLKDLRQKYPWFGPDGKTQVTLEQGHVTSVVVAAQHDAKVTVEEVRTVVREELINLLLGEDIPRVVINGTGIFSVGGPNADAGVVGRKIVADAYGPRVPAGGGAYSGKDPTKVDRSAAYMARQIAKTIVAHRIGGARQCVVALAYAIGQCQPEMVTAVTDAGCDVSGWVREHFKDLSPGAIIERLGLQAPEGWSYLETAAYGHYGRDIFPWETVVSCA